MDTGGGANLEGTEDGGVCLDSGLTAARIRYEYPTNYNPPPIFEQASGREPLSG